MIAMNRRDFISGLAGVVATGALSSSVFGLLPDDPSLLEWDANDLKAVIERGWADDRLGTPLDDLRTELDVIRARIGDLVAEFNAHQHGRDVRVVIDDAQLVNTSQRNRLV